MTPNDLTRGHSPQLITQSLVTTLQKPSNEVNNLQVSLEQRRSLEREIEQRVRSEIQIDLNRKMEDLNARQAYLD